jgi:hypothetical protein
MELSKMRPIMLGIVGIGLLCAAFLPAMKINIISFLGAMPMEFSLREANNGMLNTGRGWAVLLAIAGVIIVIATLLKYDDTDTKKSRGRITGGTALALLFPINLLGALDSVVAEANAEADGLALIDTSLAAGMIIPSIAFIVVTGLAWYAASQTTAQPTSLPTGTPYTLPTPPRVSSFTAVYDPTASNHRPKWMTGSDHR